MYQVGFYYTDALFTFLSIPSILISYDISIQHFCNLYYFKRVAERDQRTHDRFQLLAQFKALTNTYECPEGNINL